MSQFWFEKTESKRAERKRVQCAGCGRKMYQNVPKNRDYQGKSWHYDCLSNNITADLFTDKNKSIQEQTND